MLRLTSGAYTFLQRCYAAIYKRAWFKGLAAAVVLPAAIVIPQIAVADDAQQKVTLDGTTTVSEEDSTLSEWNGTEIESGQYGLGRVGGGLSVTFDTIEVSDGRNSPSDATLTTGSGATLSGNTITVKDKGSAEFTGTTLNSDLVANSGTNVTFKQDATTSKVNNFSNNGNTTVEKEATFEVGSLNNQKTLTNNGAIKVSASESSNSGNLTNNETGTITFTNKLTNTGTVTNKGELSVSTLDNQGSVLVSAGKVTVNNYTQNPDSKQEASLTVSEGATLNLTGVSSIGSSAASKDKATEGQLVNNGTLNVNSGTLTTTAAVDNNGTMTVDSYATLTVKHSDNGNYDKKGRNGAEFINKGVFNNNGITAVGDGTEEAIFANSKNLNNEGTLSIKGNSAIKNYAEITNKSTINVEQHGTLQNIGSGKLKNEGLINFTNATFTNLKTVDNDKTLSFAEESTFGNTGTINNNKNSELIFKDNSSASNSGTINNQGTIQLDSSKTFSHVGTLNLLDGSTLTSKLNNSSDANRSLGTLSNGGYIYVKKAEDDSTTSGVSSNVNITNAGTFVVEDGAVLNVKDQGSITQIQHSGFKRAKGSTEVGTGIINFGDGSLFELSSLAESTNYVHIVMQQGSTLDLHKSGELYNSGTFEIGTSDTAAEIHNNGVLINNNSSATRNSSTGELTKAGGIVINNGSTLISDEYSIINFTGTSSLIDSTPSVNDDDSKGKGMLRMDPGSVLRISYGSVLDNAAYIQFNGGVLSNEGTINNLTSGTIDVQKTIYNNGVINNEGGVITVATGAVLYNGQNGKVNLNSGTSSGAIINNSGAQVTVSGDSGNNNGNVTFEGANTQLIFSGTNAKYTNSGTLNLNNGAEVIAKGTDSNGVLDNKGILKVTGLARIGNNAILQLNEGSSFNNEKGALLVDLGATLEVNNDTVNKGGIDSLGTVTLAQDKTLTNTGGMHIKGKLDNKGTINNENRIEFSNYVNYGNASAMHTTENPEGLWIETGDINTYGKNTDGTEASMHVKPGYAIGNVTTCYQDEDIKKAPGSHVQVQAGKSINFGWQESTPNAYGTTGNYSSTGQLDNDGYTRVLAGSSRDQDGQANFYAGSTLYNHGIFEVLGLFSDDGARVENGGLFVLDSKDLYTDSISVNEINGQNQGQDAYFHNYGKILAKQNVIFNEHGTVAMDSGIMEITRTDDDSDYATVTNHGYIKVYDGTSTFKGKGTLDNATVAHEGNGLVNDSNYSKDKSSTGKIEVVNGSTANITLANLVNSGDITDNGTINITGTTVKNKDNGRILVDDKSSELSAGGPGKLNLSGVDFTGSDSASLVVEGSSSQATFKEDTKIALNDSSSMTVYSDAVIQSEKADITTSKSAEINVKGFGTLNLEKGSLTMGNSSSLNIAAKATFKDDSAKITMDGESSIKNSGYATINSEVETSDTSKIVNSYDSTQTYDDLSEDMQKLQGYIKFGNKSNFNGIVENNSKATMVLAKNAYFSNTLTNAGNLNVDGSMDVEAEGTFTNKSGGTTTVASGKEITNAGKTILEGNSKIEGTEDSTFKNTGSIVSKDGDTSKVATVNVAKVVNSGSITSGDQNTVTADTSKVGIDFNKADIESSGTITANSNITTTGELKVQDQTGSVAGEKKVTVNDGATVTVGSATYAGGSELAVNKGGTFAASNGDVVLENGAQTEVNGILSVQHGNLNVSGEMVINTNRQDATSGTVIIGSDTKTSEMNVLSGGSVTNNGQLTVNKGSALNVDGSFENNSKLDIKDTATLTVNKGADFENTAAGQITVGEGSTVTMNKGSVFVNNGKMEVAESGHIETKAGAVFKNNSADSSLIFNEDHTDGEYNKNATIYNSSKIEANASVEFAKEGEVQLNYNSDTQQSGSLYIKDGKTVTNQGAFTVNAENAQIYGGGTFINDVYSDANDKTGVVDVQSGKLSILNSKVENKGLMKVSGEGNTLLFSGNTVDMSGIDSTTNTASETKAENQGTLVFDATTTTLKSGASLDVSGQSTANVKNGTVLTLGSSSGTSSLATVSGKSELNITGNGTKTEITNGSHLYVKESSTTDVTSDAQFNVTEEDSLALFTDGAKLNLDAASASIEKKGELNLSGSDTQMTIKNSTLTLSDNASSNLTDGAVIIATGDNAITTVESGASISADKSTAKFADGAQFKVTGTGSNAEFKNGSVLTLASAKSAINDKASLSLDGDSTKLNVSNSSLALSDKATASLTGGVSMDASGSKAVTSLESGAGLTADNSTTKFESGAQFNVKGTDSKAEFTNGSELTISSASSALEDNGALELSGENTTLTVADSSLTITNGAKLGLASNASASFDQNSTLSASGSDSEVSVTDGSSMLLDSMVTKISDSAALSLSGEGTSSTLKNGATLNVTNATVSVADKAKLEVAKSNVVLSSNAEMKVDNGATVTLDKDSILSVDDSSKLLIAASTTGGKFVNNGTVTLNGIFETDRNSSASECSDEAVGIFENRGTLDINSGSTNHNVNNGKLVNYSTVSLNGVIENGDHCIHNMKDATFTIDGEGSQIIGGSVMNYGTMNALVSNAITGASVVNTGALWLTDATGTSHGTLSKLKSYNDTNGTLYVSASALSAASTYDKALISGDASVASNIFTATDRSTQIFVVGDTSVRSPYEFDTAYGLKYVYAMDSDPGASPVAASIDDLSNPDLSVGRNATGENAYIYSYNGFIKSTVTNGVVDKNASVNGDYVSTLSNLTNVPQALVYNMLMNGYGNTADTGYKYIHEALFMDKSSGDYGRYVEVPTRLMAYSGFYQSAMQILAKTSESVNSHLSGQGIAFDPKRELGLSLWMVPFFAHQENDGFGAGNLSYDSKVNIRGVTIGMDRQDDEWIYGGFLNLGSSCSAGERLAAGASAEYDFWGLGLYGHYTHDKFRLDGQAGITFMHGTMEYDTPITGFGTLSASPDLKMWDAELTASYGIELNSPDWELRPSAGIKFRHFDADDYDLNSEAGTILHTSPDDINQWIAPVRVALSHDFDTDSQWHHTIKVDAGIDFVLGDVKSVDHSSYYGFDDVMSLNTEIADHEIFRANAGWSFSKEHFLGRISAGIGHSEHMDEYSISGELRYQF